MNTLTVELWRPAPGETIKTDSPTQGDTQEKVPLLGSPTNDLLAGTAGGTTPAEVTFQFTLTQRLDLCNDPTNLQKRSTTISKDSADGWAWCRPQQQNKSHSRANFTSKIALNYEKARCPIL